MACLITMDGVNGMYLMSMTKRRMQVARHEDALYRVRTGELNKYCPTVGRYPQLQ